MINPKELRIGNRISVNECEYEVTGISKQAGGEYEINAVNNRMNVINVSPQECNPIEFTEQTLSDIGFEPFGNTELMQLKVTDFLRIIAIIGNDEANKPNRIAISTIRMYPFRNGDDIKPIEGREFIPIRHLHQLQNLYAALKATELF